MSAENEFC